MHLLNRYLDDNIAIHDLLRVQPDAHARFDATARTYEYHLGYSKQPFKQGLVYVVPTTLDIDKMNAAAQILLEYQDFEAFAKKHSDVKTFLCDISFALGKQSSRCYIYHHANRFLRNMVRAIVGTLLEVGRGKISVEEMHQIIQSKEGEKRATRYRLVVYTSPKFIIPSVFTLHEERKSKFI